jgi:hypothetical protein
MSSAVEMIPPSGTVPSAGASKAAGNPNQYR